MKLIKDKYDYDGALARLTQVCAEYDTTTAHFAILALFENRLEMLAQEIRDTSSSPSGLSSEQNSDVEWIVGRVVGQVRHLAQGNGRVARSRRAI
jgi:hypothetical protein